MLTRSVVTAVAALAGSSVVAVHVWRKGLRAAHASPRRHTARDGVTAAPLDVIPATADADPGYHTGLSIIHVITALEARAAASKL